MPLPALPLPNYFLADLPAEAPVAPPMLSEAAQTLRRNRDRYLASRSLDSLVATLDELARQWLEPSFRFRQLALELGPAATGFSSQTIACGLDALFQTLSAAAMQALVRQDLGHASRLDHLSASESETATGRAALVTGPELTFHLAAGSLPNPAVTSIVLGLLTRSAQLLKCPTGQSLLPRLFAHSLYDADPKLGACLEIAEWPGGDESIEAAVLAEADCVTAMGSDETVASLRRKVPASTRFLGYGHRVSFGYVAKEGLTPVTAPQLVADAAEDVVAWDQQGCLSPHLFYVETGSRLTSLEFAERLADELAGLERTRPRGLLGPREAAAITTRRNLYRIRAAHFPETKLWASHNSTAWTVVHENDPLFQLSCLNRFIYVKSVPDLEQALQGADAVRRKVSTVALAATPEKSPLLARRLAQWGATRVCPFGRMQRPPLAWRHDGRPALADLVTWTDWEKPAEP